MVVVVGMRLRVWSLRDLMNYFNVCHLVWTCPHF
jgi:hypothetical protein